MNLNIFKILLLITVSLIVISSFESFTVGKDDLLLLLNNRNYNLSIIDFFILLTTFFALLRDKWHFKTNIFLISISIVLVLMLSIFTAHFNQYVVKGFIGSEFRGLILWLFMIISFTSYFNEEMNYRKIYKLYIFIFVLLIFRTVYELVVIYPKSTFTDRYLYDAGHLMLMASMFVVFFSMLIFQKNNKILFTIFCLSLFLLILFGNRRIAILIAIGGSLFVIFYRLLLYNKKFRFKILNVSILTIIALFTYTYFEVQEYFSIDITEYNEDTSDYEHLGDILDAVNIINEHPVLGAGMGVEIADRVLNKYGWDTPFHSPYTHTWVRLGLFGFSLYILLLFFILNSLLKSKKPAYLDDNSLVLLHSTCLGLSSYLIFQITFPPFYLDPKQSLFVSLTFSVILSLLSKRVKE